MELKNRLLEDLKAAMRDQREPDRTLLRSLISAIKNEEIALGQELAEDEGLKLLQKQLKQREEAAAAAASRPELAESERAEAELIRAYLPEPLSEAELAELVGATISETGASGPSDMGKVMAALKPKIAGRADGGVVAGMVKQRLG